MMTTSTEPSRPVVERSPPKGGRLQIGMAEIKSESVADFIPESVADLLRNQHSDRRSIAITASCFDRRFGSDGGTGSRNASIADHSRSISASRSPTFLRFSTLNRTDEDELCAIHLRN